MDDVRDPLRQRKPPEKPKGERGKFASAMARAEFGRFYWSGEQAARLEQAMRAPKPAAANKRKPKD